MNITSLLELAWKAQWAGDFERAGEHYRNVARLQELPEDSQVKEMCVKNALVAIASNELQWLEGPHSEDQLSGTLMQAASQLDPKAGDSIQRRLSVLEVLKRFEKITSLASKEQFKHLQSLRTEGVRDSIRGRFTSIAKQSDAWELRSYHPGRLEPAKMDQIRNLTEGRFPDISVQSIGRRIVIFQSRAAQVWYFADRRIQGFSEGESFDALVAASRSAAMACD